MTTVAIIPARGGSKSVPRKNVLPVAGKPLIAHTIIAALEAEAVDRVFVSTDDAEIASAAREYGAEVIDRPVELATDEASSESALLHALQVIEAQAGERPELTVFLQCTSPFTTGAHIDACVSQLNTKAADSIFSAVPFHGFVWREGAMGMDGANHDKRIRERRQDRAPEFLENGAIYVMRTAGFIEHEHRFFGSTAVFEMEPDTGWEIDTETDLAHARLALGASDISALPAHIAAIAFDFDGVFTDDLVTVDQDGRESARCSRRDGMGIEQLRKHDLAMIVISKERVPIVAQRCEKLKLPVEHGVDDKLTLLKGWLEREGIAAQNAIFVGNDINDIECMQYVGCGVAPADAHISALQAANLVLSQPGGRGAVRELTDMVAKQFETQANRL